MAPKLLSFQEQLTSPRRQ